MSDPTTQPDNRGAARRWPPLGPLAMAVAVVALLAYVIVTSLGFTILRVKINPLLFGSLTMVVALIVLVDQARRFAQVRDRMSAGEDADQAVEDANLDGGYLERGEVEGLIWFGVLIALFLSLGFMIGMPLFMLIFLRLYGRESWVMSIALTVGTMIVLYLMFIDFLGVRTYPGMLGIPLPFGL